MANLYYQLPIEDFTFDQDKGFNYNYNGAQNFGINPSVYTDEAVAPSTGCLLAGISICISGGPVAIS